MSILNTETQSKSGFAALGVTGNLLKSTIGAGFADPKPIQRKAIPPLIAGRDIIGIAQTGSGKTAAFALPILARLLENRTKRLPRTAGALILAPTRELAVQIEETVKLLSKGMNVTTCLVLGGVSRGTQVKRMQQGVDVLVATPGRLADLVREGEVKLGETRWLVLDEADRMLDMGFIHEVKRLAKATSRDRQTALFSATMPDEIAELAQDLLKSPVRVDIAPQGTTAGEIEQRLIMARVKQKRFVLARLLADEAMSSVMIFSRTKHGADRVARDLERDGFEAAVIHGNKSQNARQKALNGFRDGSMRILVATDIAARGIDVPGISHVINFDLPDEPESYVHRIGRTGRNGADGIAITLCDPAEASKLRAVEKVIRGKIPLVGDHTRDAPLPEEVRAAQNARTDEARREQTRSDKPRQGKPRQAKPRSDHGGRPDARRAPRAEGAERPVVQQARPASARPEGAEGQPQRKRKFKPKRAFGGGRPGRRAA